MAGSDFEVVVAGGGPGGSAAAITLARAGRRVLLVDLVRRQPPPVKIGETLPGAAKAVLRDLGLLERLGSAQVATRCTGTSAAWGDDRPHAQDAVRDPHGHGWHLRRIEFDAWMRTQARLAGAEICHGRVLAPRPGSGGRPDGDGPFRLRIDGPAATVTCRWVIDATGRHTVVARRLGAGRQRSDRLVGLYATVRLLDDDPEARTRVEATPSGWWYSAPVGPARRVVALLTDADLVAPAWRTSMGFRAALRQTSHVLAGRSAEVACGPVTTAAHGARLTPPVGARWLAVGDAAMSFDPLSSQGILNALITGREGATAVDAALAGDTAPSDAYRRMLTAVWASYEANRARAYASEQRWPQAAFWVRR